MAADEDLSVVIKRHKETKEVLNKVRRTSVLADTICQEEVEKQEREGEEHTTSMSTESDVEVVELPVQDAVVLPGNHEADADDNNNTQKLSGVEKQKSLGKKICTDKTVW
ncbi:hypothetical protein DPMN_090949 [Dreissena polymorpha]|uniref:Uncharacterized protein n=1 Tax=Dreissena polymorpha TaxID=45954 RepID=A0A9D4KZ07_DREPO|nr:hypothetical protein DPMN_090949 [Dreissena polymorpha]